MKGWHADFVNDPRNDYNLFIEITYNDIDVAAIRVGEERLELKWYPNEDELIVSVDWMLGILNEAKKRIRTA